MERLKALGVRVFKELPSHMGNFLNDFRMALPLLESSGGDVTRLVTRRDLLRVTYTARQFQKVGGFIFIACLPVVGTPVGVIGLCYPRNLLTRHFWSEEEEVNYLKKEYADVNKALLALDASGELESPLSFSCSSSSPCLDSLSRQSLLHLSTVFGIRMIGVTELMQLFPRSFLRRWLEIKCRDTCADDVILREMLLQPTSCGPGSSTTTTTDITSTAPAANIAHTKTQTGKQSGGTWVSLSDLDVVRAAAERGLDPHLPPQELRQQLLEWVGSETALRCTPPPPLTPNVLERMAAVVGEVLGANSMSSPATAPPHSTVASPCGGGGGANAVPGGVQTARLFAKFMLSPLTNGPAIVHAHRHGSLGGVGHAAYLLGLARWSGKSVKAKAKGVEDGHRRKVRGVRDE